MPRSGHADGLITSAPIADPVILDISGGVVSNAVPGEAWAVVRGNADVLRMEGHYRGALVVQATAAHEIAVLFCHLKGLEVPTGAGRHHIHVPGETQI